jgi:hypothetical protein
MQRWVKLAWRRDSAANAEKVRRPRCCKAAGCGYEEAGEQVGGAKGKARTKLMAELLPRGHHRLDGCVRAGKAVSAAVA